MTEFIFFLKGLIIGLLVSAPVGPLALICIRRTLVKNRLCGFVAGLGVATSDLFYAIVAGFSITLIYNFIIAEKLWFRLIGGLFLVYLGLRTILFKQKEKFNDKGKNNNNLVHDFLSTFFIALAGPFTLVFFLAIFSGLGIGQTDYQHFNTVVTIIGIFIGSVLWWGILSSLVDLFKERFNDKLIALINKVVGIVVLIFGILILFSPLFSQL